jgi:hypothetical protein
MNHLSAPEVPFLLLFIFVSSELNSRGKYATTKAELMVLADRGITMHSIEEHGQNASFQFWI